MVDVSSTSSMRGIEYARDCDEVATVVFAVFYVVNVLTVVDLPPACARMSCKYRRMLASAQAWLLSQL